MAIFRCNKCGHLREVTNSYIGRSANCPECRQVNPIHDTAEFIKKVLEKYFTQREDLQALQQQLAPSKVLPSVMQESFADIDIFDTTALADHQQYEPILAWLKQRQIQLDVDYQAVDTSGFFDEIAVQLGDNYQTLKFVSEQIKYRQGKGHSNARLDLSKKSQKETRVITQFCGVLYDYSFVARYHHDKKSKIVSLTLQETPVIVSFFNGIWMEWFVFMKLLAFFRERQTSVACLRSLSVKFANEDVHELDIFFLIGDIPLCIECKTGEYRKDIKKYSTLRKRLKLEKEQFLLCAMNLDEQQMRGLNSMYDVTFVNADNFLEHVEQLVAN